MANPITALNPSLRPLPDRRQRFSGDGPSSGDDGDRAVISNGRLAILILLAAESMLFSGFIGSFLVFKVGSTFWPPPGLPRLPLFVTSINTVVLLSSAGTMTVALLSIRHGRTRALQRWLVITGVLGLTFLGIQGSEW